MDWADMTVFSGKKGLWLCGQSIFDLKFLQALSLSLNSVKVKIILSVSLSLTVVLSNYLCFQFPYQGNRLQNINIFLRFVSPLLHVTATLFLPTPF